MGNSEFDKDLKEFLDRKPFQSFVIEQKVGEPIVVTDRGALGLVGGGSAILIGPERKDFQFVDADNVIRIIAAASANAV